MCVAAKGNMLGEQHHNRNKIALFKNQCFAMRKLMLSSSFKTLLLASHCSSRKMYPLLLPLLVAVAFHYVLNILSVDFEWYFK